MPLVNILIGLLISASAGVSVAQAPDFVDSAFADAPVLRVPFYSQFSDIDWPDWRSKSCGVASLAMIIDFYNSKAVLPQTLLEQGINNGAFISGAGWSHRGLANLAEQYELEGNTYDLSNLTMGEAFEKFEKIVEEGPVIASVRYKLEPDNPIPHLVVVNDIKNGLVYYNDPAADSAGQDIAISDFMAAWKKRFISIRPQD